MNRENLKPGDFIINETKENGDIDLKVFKNKQNAIDYVNGIIEKVEEVFISVDGKIASVPINGGKIRTYEELMKSCTFSFF